MASKLIGKSKQKPLSPDEKEAHRSVNSYGNAALSGSQLAKNYQPIIDQGIRTQGQLMNMYRQNNTRSMQDAFAAAQPYEIQKQQFKQGYQADALNAQMNVAAMERDADMYKTSATANTDLTKGLMQSVDNNTALLAGYNRRPNYNSYS